MTIQSFTIKAVSDAALTNILVSNGLLILGEGPPRNATGVITSQIGGAVLGSTGATLDGRFASWPSRMLSMVWQKRKT